MKINETINKENSSETFKFIEKVGSLSKSVRLICPIPNCGYSTTSWTRFEWHHNKHTGHPCEVASCTYVGKTRSLLRKHMVVHLESKVNAYSSSFIYFIEL